jgi:hypothetical protein
VAVNALVATRASRVSRPSLTARWVAGGFSAKRAKAAERAEGFLSVRRGDGAARETLESEKEGWNTGFTEATTA